MERDTERGGLSLCDKVRQGSEDIMEKMDRQETSTEDSKGRPYDTVWHSGKGDGRVEFEN